MENNIGSQSNKETVNSVTKDLVSFINSVKNLPDSEIDSFLFDNQNEPRCSTPFQREVKTEPVEIHFPKDQQYTFKNEDDIQEIKVGKDFDIEFTNLGLMEPYFIILRRVDQYQVVAIEGDTKYPGEEDGFELWPFRISIIGGRVERQEIPITGDTTHFGYVVNFGVNNKASMKISRVSSLLTTNERSKIAHRQGGKFWALQILDSRTHLTLASARIKVVSEVRKRTSDSNSDQNTPKRLKIKPKNEVDYIVMNIICINDGCSASIEDITIMGPMTQEAIPQVIKSARSSDLKESILRSIAENFILAEEKLDLKEEELFFTVKTTSEFGKKFLEQRAPLSSLNHPDRVEALTDPSDKTFHVIEANVKIDKMMERYRQQKERQENE